jgi:leucyl aminopeptidase (aminopeptidase T)
MEYKIGIEMQDEYLNYEVFKSAYKLVENIMLVEKNENVVITADTSTDRRVVEAIGEAAFSIGADPIILYYPTSYKAFEEPIKPIAEAVAVADVWIELAYYPIMHTPAFRKSMEFGTRYTCLTGMDVTMLVNTIGNVNVDVLIEFGEYITNKVEESDEVIIKDKNGTNLKAYNQGRKVKHSGQRATKKGYPVMLGGQVSWCPVEETINGTLVFDAALFPPSELGILSSNVELTLEEGRVVNINGGEDAEIFKKWMASFNDENMYRLAHYSIGFNPGVKKPTGRIVEDERIFGCIEFGLGSQGESLMGAFWNAASHTDGIVSKPTIILDGEIFEENGKYVDEKAIEFCKKLEIEGY